MQSVLPLNLLKTVNSFIIILQSSILTQLFISYIFLNEVTSIIELSDWQKAVSAWIPT